MIGMSNIARSRHRFELEDDGKLLVGAARRVDLPSSIILHRTSLGYYLDASVVVLTYANVWMGQQLIFPCVVAVDRLERTSWWWHHHLLLIRCTLLTADRIDTALLL
jgi:hypothetical protein